MKLTLKNHIKRLQKHFYSLDAMRKKHAERIKDLEERVSILERKVWREDA